MNESEKITPRTNQSTLIQGEEIITTSQEVESKNEKHIKKLNDVSELFYFDESQCEELLSQVATKVHIDKPSAYHNCNKCGEVFSNPETLNSHMENVHIKAEILPVFNEVNYLSPLKERPIDSLKALRRNFDTVHKDHTVCPICAKKVKYLNGHIKQQHTETPNENHVCNDCGKVFTQIRKLRAHTNAVHKVQLSMCDICSQEFKNTHALRSHKAKVHENIIKVNCPSCSKVCDTRLKLYFHERAVHTSEESPCQVCGKIYKNKNLLQKHIRVYHKDL